MIFANGYFFRASATAAATEVRYERLHPAELRAALQRSPIAWVPWGALEFHGEHLPAGVDSFTVSTVWNGNAALNGATRLP